jgi:glycosyltransferase involved in cell wall biosynthesis
MPSAVERRAEQQPRVVDPVTAIATAAFAPDRAPAISVVIPAHNEQEHVRPLYDDIRVVLDGRGENWELVFVNDGSDDETHARLRELQSADSRVRVVDLDGNFGEAAALSAGFRAARGDIIVTLDGDGQNDPADIPRLLAALEQPGITVVSGRRLDRHEDALLRVWPSRLANYLIAGVTGLPTHDCGCGLKAYRRRALPRIDLPPGMNRFLPAIFGVTAAEFREVQTRDRPRLHGQSHYGIGRTIIVLRDLPALPFIIRAPQRAHVTFVLFTAGAAGIGALFSSTHPVVTALCDIVALACGLVWWNLRRFNRIQSEGAYRIRAEEPCDSASA